MKEKVRLVVEFLASVHSDSIILDVHNFLMIFLTFLPNLLIIIENIVTANEQR